MKVSKRDFLKMIGLGAGATVVATNGSALPTDTAIMPLPTVAAGPGAIGTGKIVPQHDCYLEARDAIIYDSVRFEPGTFLPKRFQLFQVPVGQWCPHRITKYGHTYVKGLEDTNMQCHGTFPAPMAFWVKTIHVAIAPDTSETDDRLARQFAWQFFGCQKRYAGGPCVIDVQRASIADFMKRKARAPRVSMNFEETKGLYIPPQFYFSQHFYTQKDNLQVDPKGNGLTFISALEGVEWCGVQ